MTKLGLAVLENLEVPHNKYCYWIGAAALLGFIILFNVLFTFSLMYLNRKLQKPFVTVNNQSRWSFYAFLHSL